MFATHPLPSSPLTPFRQTGHYTPARPSPLCPRSSNIATPPWTMGAMPQKPGADENAQGSRVAFTIHSDPQHQRQQQQQGHYQRYQQEQQQQQQQQQSPTLFGTFSSPLFSTQTQHHQSPAPVSPGSPSPCSMKPKYANRYSAQIANPLKTSNSLARSKTRKMFLNRVRNDRDTGRFEARGEQMMMMEHLSEKRRWEESMARDADGVMVGYELEEDDMLPDQEYVDPEDEYLVQEESMAMAGLDTHHLQSTGPNPSFSDDEYDDLFMSLSEQKHSTQDMDMS
ncbi:hypothetical protein NUU61_003241 [Penicillium alfredii]|uniref:Uncharacterized protein n=1 Tax=Penicillium alfredii TaxID=1506179 RepID=A0A9W9FT30_9EURO|nr:uncharacterized protein NUU61_003241 [Penicillium alfredii]KAJ5105894.1 hypothetical protein NUU61_003241 [Penicillium alfredii]